MTRAWFTLSEIKLDYPSPYGRPLVGYNSTLNYTMDPVVVKATPNTLVESGGFLELDVAGLTPKLYSPYVLKTTNSQDVCKHFTVPSYGKMHCYTNTGAMSGFLQL